MDTIAFIMAVECDPEELTVEEYIDGMAEMVRTRLAFNLQGSWMRAAMHLIDGGIINDRGVVLAYPEIV